MSGVSPGPARNPIGARMCHNCCDVTASSKILSTFSGRPVMNETSPTWGNLGAKCSGATAGLDDSELSGVSSLVNVCRDLLRPSGCLVVGVCGGDV